jgi:hypothetical protein
LYSCGSSLFYYELENYFNGPNYDLEILLTRRKSQENDEGEEDLFGFMPKNLSKAYESDDFPVLKFCNFTYIMPMVDGDGGLNLTKNILICIHNETRNISAYEID